MDRPRPLRILLEKMTGFAIPPEIVRAITPAWLEQMKTIDPRIIDPFFDLRSKLSDLPLGGFFDSLPPEQRDKIKEVLQSPAEKMLRRLTEDIEQHEQKMALPDKKTRRGRTGVPPETTDAIKARLRVAVQDGIDIASVKQKVLISDYGGGAHRSTVIEARDAVLRELGRPIARKSSR